MRSDELGARARETYERYRRAHHEAWLLELIPLRPSLSLHESHLQIRSNDEASPCRIPKGGNHDH